MKKRMFQMLAAVIAIVAILGFIKFQQIQAAIAAGKSFTMPPEAVTSVVATQDQWQGTIQAVGGDAVPRQTSRANVMIPFNKGRLSRGVFARSIMFLGRRQGALATPSHIVADDRPIAISAS